MFIDGSSSLVDLLGPNWATALRARELAAIETSEAEPADPIVIRPADDAANDLPDVSSPPSNEESIRREILQRLNAMDGYQFEQLVARVLDGAGLRNAQVVGRSGDEGVDILAAFIAH
jgi:restriction endonuclease Mrr